MKKVLASQNAPAALGPYSQAIQTGGFVFASGQLGLTADGKLAEGGVREQAMQVMANIKAVLAEAGLDFSHVVKSTCFLTDMADFPVFNEVYGSHFSEPYPARSTFQVAALPGGGVVEVEVIARVP